MRQPVVFAAIATLASFVSLHAQARHSGPDTNPYIVEYHLLDKADANGPADRHYSLMVNGEHKGAFKMGSRTPAVSESFSPTAPNSLITTQYTYLDVGVNIECTVTELDTRVQLHTALDLSSVDKEATASTGGVRNPTIKEAKLEVNTTLQIGKPTVLASITDPATNRMLQVTVTVTAAN